MFVSVIFHTPPRDNGHDSCGPVSVITLSSYAEINQHAGLDTKKQFHGRAPTHLPSGCLCVMHNYVQLGREQDSREGLSGADVRGTTLASVCSVCSGKRQIERESTQLPLTGSLMADTQCLVVDWVLFVMECAVWSLDLTLFSLAQGGVSPQPSPIIEVHWKISIPYMNC